MLGVLIIMRLATIGTNWITSTFIESAKKTNQLTLQAVYSRSMEKAKEFAALHGAKNYTDNLQELAENPEIDIVYIASPNSLHFEQAILFLTHNIHVICEKPIFSTTKELEQAYKIAEQHGVYLFEAIRNIHTPNMEQLIKHLSCIGKVRSANLHYIQYSSRYDAFLDGNIPNVFSPKYSGGALVDLGVYPLSLAIKLFGEPENISYHPVILNSGVDGNGTLILKYNDFTCTIMCSKISQSFMPSEIHGESGTIVLNSVTPTTLEWIDHKTNKRTSFEVQQDEHDMIYEINTFIQIIQTKDNNTYNELKQLSTTVLSITEKARKDNNIIFGV